MMSQDRTQCDVCGTWTLDEQLEHCGWKEQTVCRSCHVTMHYDYRNLDARAARRDRTLLKEVEHAVRTEN